MPKKKKKQTPARKKKKSLNQSRKERDVSLFSIRARTARLRRMIIRARRLGNTADVTRMTKELRELVAGTRKKVKEV